MKPTVHLILSLATLALPMVTYAVQTPPAFSTASSIGSYVASGSTMAADLARLRAALLKVTGVEQVDLLPRPGGVTLHIRGPQTGTLFATAARAVGYNLRTMSVRTYLATGSSADTDLTRLREALTKASDVELVELGKSNGAPVLRIRGEASAPALIAVARTVGFEMLPVSSYVASGSTADADLIRLRKALGSVAGVGKIEMRGLPGGATVVIHGDVTDAALAKTAKSVGFGLLPVSDAGGAKRFGVIGVVSASDEERLNKALHELVGGGEFHLIKTPTGMQLDVIGSADSPDKISAAAKAIGVDLHPLEMVTALSVDANGERITPPAPGERTLEELAKMGEPAPSFTLITKDGKSTVSLSSYRGKRPVVLIFGSYT